MIFTHLLYNEWKKKMKKTGFTQHANTDSKTV